MLSSYLMRGMFQRIVDSGVQSLLGSGFHGNGLNMYALRPRYTEKLQCQSWCLGGR